MSTNIPSTIKKNNKYVKILDQIKVGVYSIQIPHTIPRVHEQTEIK
jgi:hypothetical protein